MTGVIYIVVERSDSVLLKPPQLESLGPQLESLGS